MFTGGPQLSPPLASLVFLHILTEKVEEARFLTSRVEEKASLSLVLRSISLRDKRPSHDSSKTIMSFSKGNHGHGLDG